MSKSALVTGANGQDGSYLAELLLSKGYTVYGLVRRSANPNYWRIEHILKDINLIYGDLLDQNSLHRALKISKPDEVYNLAAQSHVGESFKQPQYTADVTGKGVLNILDSIRELDLNCHFYTASSSELFGRVLETPQRETTPFNPVSPYAAAKAYAHYITTNYRESYKMFNCCGILFNHESPRRGIEFVTRKVTDAVAKIKLGLQKEVRLGNLESKRDWGHARDYVEAMYLMLQQDHPDDYVIATGETRVSESCVR
jgi:GDPmannose 4,6-dehydratase